MSQSDVLQALRAIGGRGTSLDIREWFARNAPRLSPGNIHEELRRLQRWGDIVADGSTGANGRTLIWRIR